MKAIRFGFISVLVLFLLITGIGLLFSPEVTVIRQADIQAPADSIAEYIEDIRYWNRWMVDSSENIAYYTADTKGKGASAQIGHSRVTILSVDSGNLVAEWSGHRGNPQKSGFHWYPSTAIPNATTVQWYFTQHLSWYPWQRMGAVLNEKILGPSMEADLKRLQNRLEN